MGCRGLARKRAPRQRQLCEVDGQAGPAEETWCIFKELSAILEFEPEWRWGLRQGLTICPFLQLWRMQNMLGLKRADALRSPVCWLSPPGWEAQALLLQGVPTLRVIKLEQPGSVFAHTESSGHLRAVLLWAMLSMALLGRAGGCDLSGHPGNALGCLPPSPRQSIPGLFYIYSSMLCC